LNQIVEWLNLPPHQFETEKGYNGDSLHDKDDETGNAEET
jgi:hypothetical protein